MALTWTALALSAVALGLSIAALYLVLALGREWIRDGAGTASLLHPPRTRVREETVEESGLPPAAPWFFPWRGTAPEPLITGPPPGPEAKTTEAQIPAVVPGDVDDFDEGGHERVNRPTLAPASRAHVHDPETGDVIRPRPGP